MIESSQELTHPRKITSLGGGPHASRLVQIRRQNVESISITTIYPTTLRHDN